MPEEKLFCTMCKKEKNARQFSMALSHISCKNMICNKYYPRPL